jgi:hypothetical protein
LCGSPIEAIDEGGNHVHAGRENVGMAGLFDESTPEAKQMNAAIARWHRGQQSSGSPAVAGAPEMGERLSRALSDLETAERAKDPDAIAYCEHRLCQLVTEARQTRSARQEAERPRNPDGTYATFDGGYRGPRRRVEHHSMDEAANALMQRALLRSREEREAAAADPGQTTYVP